MTTCPACRADLPPGARFCPSCGTRLETLSTDTTERKVVTTLFADLVGFTALGERHDPEDIDAALRAFYVLARATVERFGGVVEKFIGDAVVGLFGVPAIHEDDAERAVRAALELVRDLHELPPVGTESLQVRCSVNTGPALVRLHARPEAGDGVLVGDAVNTAARLLAATSPMTVAVGAATRQLTHRAIRYEPLRPLTAKGKAEPVERWRATSAIARRGVEADRRDQTPTVGREVELALLAGLLDRAVASGSPQFALITGEAGIGKSRLIREFFRLVDTRPGLLCNWRQSGCPPYGSGLASWSLREIASAHAGIAPGDPLDVVEQKLGTAVASTGLGDWLVPRLLSLLGRSAAPSDRGEDLTAWTRFFESIAQSRPAVVIIEDLHWAGDPTLEFLRYFVAQASGVPLLLVGTARPEFAERHPDVFEGQPAVTPIALKALGPGDSARLAQALLPKEDDAELAARVAERCGGSPLFAEELTRFLADRRPAGGPQGAAETHLEAPTSILTLIAARLDALPPGQRDLLADAAVIGQVFWPAAVAAVHGVDVDDAGAVLELLEQREFLRRHADSAMEGEAELSFWHALVRDVAYDRLPRAARAVRHVRAARWLEQRPGDGDDLAEVIAHHYETGLSLAAASSDLALVAQSRPAARDAFVRAGDRALRLDVPAAGHYYALAMETAGDRDPATPGLLLKRAEALMAVGRSRDAVGLQREAALRYEATGDAVGQAYAFSQLAYALDMANSEEGSRVAERAVDLLDDAPSRESISVLEMWATLRLWRGDLPAVLAATERILVMSERLGQSSPPRALSLHGYARFMLGDREGLGEMLEAITLAEQSGTARELFGLREVYARCTCIAEDPDKALASTRSWIAEAQQRKDAQHIVELGVYAARYHLLCGRWDEALGTAAGLVDEDQLRESPVVEAELCAVNVAGNLGRGTPEVAARDAERYEVLLPTVGSEHPPFGNIVVAASARGRGATARAVRLLEQLPQTNFAMEPIDVLWWPLAVRTAIGKRQSGLAARIAEAALAWPACPARVRASLSAVLAEHEGRTIDAARDYEAAARAWHSVGSPHEEGLALVGLSRCLLTLGRESEAETQLADARILFERIGSRLALAKADELRQTSTRLR